MERKHIFRRALSMLLCLSMLLGSVPLNAFATETDEDERTTQESSEEREYTDDVTTVEELPEEVKGEEGEEKNETETVENDEVLVDQNDEIALEEDDSWKETPFEDEIQPYQTGIISACGPDLSWNWDGIDTLAIEGRGEMFHYSSFDEIPWWDYRDEIQEVIIRDDVTWISEFAFAECRFLKKFTVENSESFSVYNDMLYDRDGTKLICCPGMVDTHGSDSSRFFIKRNVQSIGDYAFYHTLALGGVTIPDTVTSIGVSAFEGCADLGRITFAGDMPSISKNAFAGMNAYCVYMSDNTTFTNLPQAGGNIVWCVGNVKNATPLGGSCGSGVRWSLDNEGVLTISGHGEMDNFSIKKMAPWEGVSEYIKEVWIEDGVLSIGDCAFGENWAPQYPIVCSKLAFVSLPDSLERIGDYAFHFCPALSEITIPSGVASIGDDAFLACGNLKELRFMGKKPAISAYAFSGVTATAYYPKNDTTWSGIPSNNYGGIITWEPAEESVPTEPNGTCGENLTWTVDSSGTLVISGTGTMYDYTYEWIPNGVVDGGTNDAEGVHESNAPWFPYQIRSVVVKEGVTSIGKNAFSWCGTLSKVSLPSSLNLIDSGAFLWCTNLKSFTIPDGVTMIGTGAFDVCTNLTEIQVDVNNRSYSSDMGCLFNKAKTELIVCPKAKSGTLTIPEGVTTICSSAISGCNGLNSIVLPESLVTIGEYAFSMTEVNMLSIPKNVKTIGLNAFDDCNKLEQINVAEDNLCFSSTDGVLFNKDRTVLICYPNGKQGTYVVPDGVVTISEAAFIRQRYLTSISIPKSVRSIEKYAFNFCNSLTEVSFAGSETEWKKISIAEKNDSLISAVIHYHNDIPGTNVIASGNCGDNLTWTLDEEGALIISGTGEMWNFSSAMSSNSLYLVGLDKKDLVKSVIIKNGVSSIGNYAFCDYNSLMTAVIPDSITSIGYKSFDSCDSLTDVVIPDGVKDIDEYAFASCYALSQMIIPGSVSSIGNYAFTECQGLTNIVIKDGVMGIGDSSFSGCMALTDVFIPCSVKTIGEGPFLDCSSLTEITVADNNQFFSSENGVLFDKAKTVLVQYPGGMNGAYSVPEGVTAINRYAFCGCENLLSIVIPDSVVSIGANAFRKCISLTSATIGSSVSEIGSSAFYFCISLERITFTGSAPRMEAEPFWNVTSTVFYPGTDQSWEDKKYSYGGNLTWIPAGYCGDNITWMLDAEGCLTISGSGAMQWHPFDQEGYPWYAYRQNIKKLIVEAGVTSIEENAFLDCRNMTEVTINDGMKAIQLSAFQGCENLTTVSIPNSVTAIGYGAFAECSKLTDVYYSGTEAEWNEINIQLNPELGKATIHFMGTAMLEKLESIHYLAFSELAYKDWNVGDKVYDKLKDNWNSPAYKNKPEIRNDMLFGPISDWTVVYTSEKWGYSISKGFYAVAFQGNVAGESKTIIAYRGSRNLFDFFENAVDVISDWNENDFQFQLAHFYTEQLQDAQNFYLACRNHVDDVHSISVTGHSLGGALASTVVMVYGVYGEVFNAGSAFEALYLQKTPYMVIDPMVFHQLGRRFEGVDKWNILAHVTEGDPIGAWLKEYTHMNFRRYRKEGGSIAHMLDTMICVKDGKVVFTDVLNASSSPEEFIGYDSKLYLGTSGDDIFLINNDSAMGFTVFCGSGNDEIIITGFSNDRFAGGKSTSGSTIIRGGAGNDEYYFYKGDGQLHILDSSGQDTIYLNNFSEGDVIEYSPPAEGEDTGAIMCNGKVLIYINMNRSNLSGIQVVLNNSEKMKIQGFNWGLIHKTVMVACPTDVDILDANGNIVQSLKNGINQTTCTDYGNFYVFNNENGESVKYAEMIEGYSFLIHGVDSGKMNVAYCEDEGAQYQITGIPVTSGMTAVIVEGTVPQLSIDNDGDGVEDSVLPMSKVVEQSPCEEHIWNAGEVTTLPTHTEDGEMTYTCTVCGQTKTEAVDKLTDHVFDQEVPNEKYLASAATCEAPAIYFKSCICGETGEEIFEYGEPTGHSFSDEWSIDETHHWHKAICEHENEVDGFEAHIWNGNICQVCGYAATKQECTSTQETGIREGRFHLFVGNKDMGLYELAQSGKGWTIQDADGYLAVKNNKLVRAANPFVWNYSSRFYVTVRNSGLGSLLKPSTSWYLSANNNGLIVTTSKSTVTIWEDVSAQSHSFSAWTDNLDGTHRRSCLACGEVETDRCTYDHETHLCICGAYDPAFRSVSVNVSFDKRVTRILFIIRKVTYYARINVEASGTSVRKVEYSTTGGRTWQAGTTVSSNREVKDFLIRVTDSSGMVYRFACRNGQVEAQ